MEKTATRDGYPVLIVPGPTYPHRYHARLVRLGRAPVWNVFKPPLRDYGMVYAARLAVRLPEFRESRFVITHPDLTELLDLLPPGLEEIPSPKDSPSHLLHTWA